MAQEDLDSDLVVFVVTTTMNESCNLEGWILDIGLSNHMIGHIDWMKDLDTIM